MTLKRIEQIWDQYRLVNGRLKDRYGMNYGEFFLAMKQIINEVKDEDAEIARIADRDQMKEMFKGISEVNDSYKSDVANAITASKIKEFGVLS